MEVLAVSSMPHWLSIDANFVYIIEKKEEFHANDSHKNCLIHRDDLRLKLVGPRSQPKLIVALKVASSSQIKTARRKAKLEGDLELKAADRLTKKLH